MTRIIFKISLSLLIISFGQSQEIKTVQIQFSREVQREKHTDNSEGFIYYQDDKITVQITKPLKQWMILESGVMLIYYPVEQEALRFKNTLQSTLPFLDFFIRIVNEDLGLNELGYRIDKNEFINDTLFTHWIPDEKDKNRMGPVILALNDNRIVLSESKDTKGKTIIKTLYQNYIDFQSKYLPMKMIIYQYLDTGTIVENIQYSNPLIDKPLPREILDFRIPETINIEDIE